MTLDEFKKQYSFNIEGAVEWEDMDAFQHVNNKVYFKYFEKIRIDFFEAKGLLELMTDKQLGPILASTQCRFKVPLTYPDQIVIGTYLTDFKSDRFLMNYAVYSLQHNKVAAEGDGAIVCYNYKEGKKAAIPESIAIKLQET
jgi:acyl-CoA thioester hydrolase